VLINVLQMDEDYDGALSMNDHGWRAKKLSEIDLKKFTQRFRTLLDALKAANLSIDAVEFGNEDARSYLINQGVPDTPRLRPAIKAGLRSSIEVTKAYMR
jgi:hypothetical protein